MRRIPRCDWIEWLDALSPRTKVAIVSDEDHRLATGGWTFRSADYDPFDDVVEIVLDDDGGRLRVLVESPTEILAIGTDCNPDHITILARDGRLEITRALDRAATDSGPPSTGSPVRAKDEVRAARGQAAMTSPSG